MSRNYPKILNNYFKRIESKQINLDNAAITFIFANFRQLIEEKNISSQFQILNFYSNWILHSKLDRSAVCIKTLSSIVVAISKPKKRKNFIDEICGLLNESKLREELILICRAYRIKQTLTKKRVWRLVYAQLLPELTHKPLIPQNTITPNTTLTLTAGQHHRVSLSSYVAFWLHGKRGQQAQWSIAVLPLGQLFKWKGIRKYVVKNEGMFFAP